MYDIGGWGMELEGVMKKEIISLDEEMVISLMKR